MSLLAPFFLRLIITYCLTLKLKLMLLRKTICGLGLALCLFTVTSCDDDDDDDIMEDFSGTFSGANEVPPVTTPATGTVTGSYNRSNRVLTLNMTYTGLSSAVTMWHVHKGAVGVSGPPVDGLDFGTLGVSPFSWSDTLTTAQEADLLNDLYYVNIHTANNTNGEIRAQLND